MRPIQNNNITNQNHHSYTVFMSKSLKLYKSMYISTYTNIFTRYMYKKKAKTTKIHKKKYTCEEKKECCGGEKNM